jgi:hypothetical protein
MITNTGKSIIAKYFLGHTSSYASHIAVGCGPKALLSSPDPLLNEEFNPLDVENKQSLDFEMFRVPITSRGYVRENDMTYVVLTAELPTTERYGITEVGIFSAGSNPEAGANDSKIIRSFSDLENWEQHDQSFASLIPEISNDAIDENGAIDIEDKFFRISSDSPIFLGEGRVDGNEVPRFLDSSIVARGDSAVIDIDGATGNLTPDDTVSSHIHLTGVSLNLDLNAPTDELKFAFSLVPRFLIAENPESPSEIRIVIEFASAETGEVQSALFEVNITENDDDVDFETSRYFVVTKKLQELRKTIGFSWDQVTIIKAYASVIVDGEPSDQYYIAYDGLRLENVTSINPLYGMTGYSVVKNNTGTPIVKSQNSSSFIEFRFGFQLDEYTMES